MADLSEQAQEFLRVARENDGRYYITVGDDQANAACRELVSVGAAHWVSQFNRAWPAIDLTSRGRFDDTLLPSTDLPIG